MVSSTRGRVYTMGGGTDRTGLDAGREVRVGAKPSGIKLDGIPQGNPAGIVGAKWTVAVGTVEVGILDMTVLTGGVAGVGEASLCAARTDSIKAVSLAISSFKSLFSCSICFIIFG